MTLEENTDLTLVWAHHFLSALINELINCSDHTQLVVMASCLFCHELHYSTTFLI